MSLRIGHRLALLGVVAVLGFVVVAVTYAVASSRIGRAEDHRSVSDRALALVGAARYGFLDSRRHEKDFLQRRDDKYAAQLDATAEKAGAALKSLAEIIDPSMRAEVEAIAAGYRTYVEQFRGVAAIERRLGLTEKDGLQGELRAAIHAVEGELKDHPAPGVQISMLSLRRHEKDFLLRLDASYRDKFEAEVKRFQSVLAASTIPASDQHEISGLIDRYRTAFLALVEQRLAAVEEIRKLSATFAAVAPKLDALAAPIADSARADAETGAELRSETMVVMLSTIGVAVAVLIALLVAVTRSIVGPVTAMTGAMGELAAGNLDVGVPAVERTDEIGHMAKAVQVFKQNAIDNRRMEAEARAQAEEIERVRAERARAAAAHGLVVKERIGEVEAATTKINAVARKMSDRSEKSGHKTLDVGEAARITNESAASASEATQQLALAIDEIAKQVAHSSAIARQSAEEVDATAERIAGLSASVQAIGEVVNLINDVASQTNLLALNATIEAARAGDAGKGFAVVANEVKGLANQTAKATEDIARRVDEIQRSSQAMSSGFSGVVESIRNLETVSAAIAGAVQQQEASTRAIAGNIEEVARQAQHVTTNVRDLSKSSAQACAGTIRVLWSSSTLQQTVDELGADSHEFLASLQG